MFRDRSKSEDYFRWQLQELVNTSHRISLNLPLTEILQILADQSRNIIGAHQSGIGFTVGNNWAQVIQAISLSDKYAQWRDYEEAPNGSGIYAHVCETNRPMRLSHEELLTHPRWRNFGGAVDRHPPMRGWLAVPLVNREGINIGTVQLSDKYAGDFTEDDEFILVQLSQIASVTIDNARLHEKMQRYTEELEEHVRHRTSDLAIINKELEAFNYSVSHDLRAPLRTLDGFSQILIEDYGEKLDEQASYLLQRIRRASQRMTLLIDSLLNLSRLSVTWMSESRVDLGALCDEIMAEFHEESPDREVEFKIHADMLVQGDLNLLRVMMQNLLGNALKFTRNRSPAHIEVGMQQQGGSNCVFFVRDNGVGFDMVNAERLFIAFQRLHSEDEFEGTGIGLATVQRIVNRHKGRIWFESQPTHGTTFYFTFHDMIRRPEPVSLVFD